MVVLLVTLTFVGLALLVVWTRQRAVRMARSAAVRLDQVAYHPGHMWVARVGPALYKAGADDVAASLAGMPERIEVPEAGGRVYQDVRHVRLEAHGRTVHLPAPLSGRVVAINNDAIGEPSTVAHAPYGNGWLYLVHADGQREQQRLLTGEQAAHWLDDIRRGIMDILWSPGPTAAWDAGPLQPGYGDILSDEQFQQLKDNLLGSSNQ